MDELEPRSAKDAPDVKKTLEYADDIYDAGSFQECLTALYDLFEDYPLAVLPRMKVLIMLSTLVEDWQYAENWRIDAEDIYHYCDRHRNAVFNDIVLRESRTLLERLEPYRRDVSDVTDEEVKFRLDSTGAVVTVPHSIQEATRVQEIDEYIHFAYREALISHYASLQPTGTIPNNVAEPPATTATATTTTENAKITSIQLPLRNLRDTCCSRE
ncbi:hypothetical protein D6D01_09310 [Aureobasidium pullulans]|uniref:Uncharacterized protein n=1 Tax=Aureobasidium pullulans TaxID=5580 RepID=A0A4S9K584_AURPU|nr:hypothetical protein D6D01_09310 [Aureobasidium pullulans]